MGSVPKEPWQDTASPKSCREPWRTGALQGMPKSKSKAKSNPNSLVEPIHLGCKIPQIWGAGGFWGWEMSPTEAHAGGPVVFHRRVSPGAPSRIPPSAPMGGSQILPRQLDPTPGGLPGPPRTFPGCGRAAGKAGAEEGHRCHLLFTSPKRRPAAEALRGYEHLGTERLAEGPSAPKRKKK